MLQMVTRFCCATFLSALFHTRFPTMRQGVAGYLMNICNLWSLPSFSNCTDWSKENCWSKSKSPSWYIHLRWSCHDHDFNGSKNVFLLKHVIHLNNIKPPCQIYWVGTDWGSNPVDGSSNFRQTQKEIWKRIQRKKSNKICHNMRERKGQPYDIFRKEEYLSFRWFRQCAVRCSAAPPFPLMIV